jgi:hypothetical protein
VADVAGSKQLVADLKGVFGDLAAVCIGVEPADLLATDAGRLIELSGAFDRQSSGLRALALDRALEPNITRLGDFTDAQRDAIWARAGGVCEIPGCGATSGLEIDHDHERQFGGLSNIANGSLKCRSDHLDKTHGDRRLIGPPGRRAWVHVADLPWDPAGDGLIPQDQIEHLLAPQRARPAGPAPPGAPPPGARRAPSGPAPPAEPAEGEQLDLLSV